VVFIVPVDASNAALVRILAPSRSLPSLSTRGLHVTRPAYVAHSNHAAPQAPSQNWERQAFPFSSSPPSINHHSLLITHQSSVITHHSSLISHHSSVISHQSSVISHHSSLITHHSSLITHHSSLNTHHPLPNTQHPAHTTHALTTQHPTPSTHTHTPLINQHSPHTRVTTPSWSVSVDLQPARVWGVYRHRFYTARQRIRKMMAPPVPLRPLFNKIKKNENGPRSMFNT